jgi:hypothetical protein
MAAVHGGDRRRESASGLARLWCLVKIRPFIRWDDVGVIPYDALGVFGPAYFFSSSLIL